MKRRGSGVLLHITSLPSPHGIGDLGPEAYRFADFLSEAKQSYWQVLPLNPTTLAKGNSPYSSYSAFAGNHLLISPDLLVKEGLTPKSYIGHPHYPVKIDYRSVTEYKNLILRIAYEKYRNRLRRDDNFLRFCNESSDWLEEYVLFVALREYFKTAWINWQKDIRDRRKATIKEWNEKLEDRILMEKFFQYIFFRQWSSLKNYCSSKNVQIIGDMPIYITYDSADVWVNPELFKLDGEKNPLAVAGIPPDYFSSTGQLWGNPIYRWDVLKETGYEWWVKRIAHNTKLFDFIRLDHFKGFVEYWEVPAGEETAVGGRWVKGPGEDFFIALLRRFSNLPLIAEDLGVITAEVRELRDRFEFPSMRILQYAFGSDPLAELYKPHNYIRNCIAYTGTHDNSTLMGWLSRNKNEKLGERKEALRYVGCKRGKNIHWQFIRLLMRSSANTVIIPMQDIIGFGDEARMNTPAIAEGNWEWMLRQGEITPSLTKKLAEMTELYGRA